ncbi:MAG TPA: glycosyltransferase [Anaeromyxobacter sp.]
MKILHVTCDGRGALAGRTARWLGMDFTVARFTIEDLVRFEHDPARAPRVRRDALRRAIEDVEAFDGVYAEAPEAVLLHYVRTRQRRRPVRWVVNVVDLLERVDPIRRLVRGAYGDDPLAIAAADPAVRWYVTTRAHASPLLAAGLPPERLAFVPANTAQAPILPGAVDALEGARTRSIAAPLREIAGGFLLAGVNNRDVATLAAAAEQARIPVHVLTDLERVPAVPSPSLTYHGLVPLADFVGAVAAARVVVVALHAGPGSCGQQTIAIAQHVRTLVVASDVPAVRDYVADGVSGILVPPEDAPALAAALRRAADEPRRAALVEEGFRRNVRDNARVASFFRESFGPAAAIG